MIPTRQLPKVPLLKFLAIFLTEKKISDEHFHLCEAKIGLDEVTKSIDSQTNNKFPGNGIA